MSRALSVGVFALLVLVASPAARADTVEYYGPHPVEAAYGSGMCFIEGPHVHVYEPKETVYYVQDGPYYTYVGDPTEFDQEAPRHAYYGHHPVWWTSGPGEHYCYITGAHHHMVAPIAEVRFETKGGAYWYVGAHPAWYEVRARKHKHIDRHYARAGVIVRPAVVVEPPRGWFNVSLSIGVPVAPVIVHERHAPTTVIIEDHHHHHPPAWGHYKNKGKVHDGHKHGGGGKHRGNGKGKGR